MSETRPCQKCAKDVQSNAPFGLCPKCLLTLGLDPVPPEALDSTQNHESQSSTESPQSATNKVRYFGNYELLEEIARGGMGTVYKARQTTLNRLVGLKLISAPSLATEELVKRFKTEAEAAASLSHPNIVPIYEIGEHKGQHYFSMGLIEGPNLRRVLADMRRGGASSSSQSKEPKTEHWPLASSARLVSTIARAVHYAHQRGILHRDIKPANILLDANGTPHLTDFGLAKLIEKESTLTHTNVVMGTPAYMSPEQARGDTKEVTTAADVYGLGAVLYETLTGTPPFGGGTSVETIRQVLDQEPRRPSLRNPAVDPDLETICLKCLEKEPGRRYGSAEALADDLDLWRRSEPITARRASQYERVLKWVHRRPAIAALGSLALVSLLALAIGSPIAAFRIAAAKKAEAVERKKAEGARNEAVDAANELRRTLYASEMNIAFQTWQSGDTDRARISLRQQRPKPGETDLRGWEWFYLWGQSEFKELARVTTSSPYGFWSCAFSPDGRSVAAGTIDGQVVLISPRTGQTVALVDHKIGPINPVDCLAFTPDGASLFQSRRRSSEVIVWDLPSRQSRLLVGPGTNSMEFALSPDGMTLVTVSGRDYEPFGPGEIQLWDARTGELLARGPIQANSLIRVAFSPDGQYFATGGTRGYAKVWSVPDLREVAVLPHGEQPYVFALAFSRDGRLATGTSDGLARIWNLESQRPLATWPAHLYSCDVVEWSPDGKLLATGGRDQIVRLWSPNPTNQMEMAVLKGHAGRVTGLSFSPDGQLLVSASEDKTLRSWQVTAELARARSNLPRRWRGSLVHRELAFSPDSRWLALLTEDNTVSLLSLPNLDPVVTVPGNRPAFLVDSRSLITVETNRLHMFSIPDGRLLRVFDAGEKLDGNVALAPDSTRFAMATVTGGILIWSVTNSAPERRINATNRLEGLFFGLIARELIALRADDGRLEWFDTTTGNLTRSLVTGDGSVTSAAPSPDGKWVLIAETAPRLRLVPLESGPVELVPSDMGSPVSVAWSADGQTIAAGTFEGFIKFWNTRTRREVAMLRGHISMLTSLEFSHDGRHLVSGSFDNTWRLWSAPLLREADGVAPRRLSDR